jgi:formylglycine-generating enzyme required for sulfatase activity
MTESRLSVAIWALLATVSAFVACGFGTACEGGGGQQLAYASCDLCRMDLLLARGDWVRAEPATTREGLASFVHTKSGLRFVLIPGGEFTMGSDVEDALAAPQHRVSVPTFLMCATECTQEAWAAGDIASKMDWGSRGNLLPVDNASWSECQRWCRSMGLRLPSEAEWEYSCRSGSKSKWFFGDGKEDLVRFAWFGDEVGGTHPVGMKKPNAFGLFDVHGNVWEWCADEWFRYDLPGRPDDGSAWVRAGEGPRVARGGAFNSTAEECQSAYRLWAHGTSVGLGTQGFRPAANLSE